MILFSGGGNFSVAGFRDQVAACVDLVCHFKCQGLGLE